MRAFGKVGIRCTYETDYTITIDDGQNASGGVRQMKSGTNFLAYQLFQPGCSIPWRATNHTVAAGTRRWHLHRSRRRDCDLFTARAAPGRSRCPAQVASSTSGGAGSLLSLTSWASRDGKLALDCRDSSR
ncbi:spore coat protein U domain-containing protein [Sinorhizobium psoraleae]|uniref:spore coat protein U domain-containing protein n=1 Tax=Sinorhizobium psoraleae TaxID=520838 RepID=UPI0035E3C257